MCHPSYRMHVFYGVLCHPSYRTHVFYGVLCQSALMLQNAKQKSSTTHWWILFCCSRIPYRNQVRLIDEFGADALKCHTEIQYDSLMNSVLMLQNAKQKSSTTHWWTRCWCSKMPYRNPLRLIDDFCTDAPQCHTEIQYDSLMNSVLLLQNTKQKSSTTHW